MLSVKVDFLAGRYHATPWGVHVNEGRVEWPPSLWRFMRALISVWKIACASHISQERMIGLLEKLKSPPKYFIPPYVQSHTRHYMPIKKGKGEDRALVFDAFVSLSPDESLFIIWDDVTLSKEEREALNGLLRHLNFLGRAESWCKACLCDDPPKPNCFPVEAVDVEGEIIDLLVPSVDKKIDVEKLCMGTKELRKQGYLSPPGADLCAYVRPKAGVVERREKPAKRHGAAKLAMYAVHGPVKPMMTDALVVAETVRAALQDIYGRLNEGGFSYLFSGKDAMGRPLEGHKHAYFLPLDEDKDGKIDHILVYQDDGFGKKESMALSRLEVLYFPTKGYHLQLGLLRLGSEEGLEVSVLRKARAWRSMTPFMLVRHPHWKKGKDTPMDQVRLELQRRGFPSPISIETSNGYLSHRHVSWLDYKRFRSSHRPAYNYPYGFKISFEEEASGPIALGYACHFGLGLFIPAVGE